MRRLTRLVITCLVLCSVACAPLGRRAGGVSPLRMTSPFALPAAVTGAVYAYQMTATGGTAPYAWDSAAVGTALGVSDSDCIGLEMGPDGLITGTPTAPPLSLCSVPVRVSDAVGDTATGRYLIAIVR